MKKVILVFIFLFITSVLFSRDNLRSPVNKDIPVKDSNIIRLESIVDRIHSERKMYYLLRNEWAKEEENKKKELESLKIEKEFLHKKIKKEQEQLKKYKDNIKEFEKQIEESKQEYIHYSPYFLDALSNLEEFIKKDIPYKLAQKREAIEFAGSVIKDKSKLPGEKFSELWKLIQNELNDSSRYEIYRESIETPDKKNKLVTIFRLGKIALFYRTLEGDEYGFYKKGRWISDLPHNIVQRIKLIFDMAEKRIPANIISIPLSLEPE